MVKGDTDMPALSVAMLTRPESIGGCRTVARVRSHFMTGPTTEPTYSSNDLAYLRAEYRMLEDLCVDRSDSPEKTRDAIAAGRLPQPTYVLPEGIELFPPDFFALLDSAGSLAELSNHFTDRHRQAATAVDIPTSASEHEWTNYLSGLYGACLRQVTPEAMVAKEQLIWRIETMTAAARPDDDAWVTELREAVDALDAIERPFTDYDRQRWGGTSRDSHITAVREKYLS